MNISEIMQTNFCSYRTISRTIRLFNVRSSLVGLMLLVSLFFIASPVWSDWQSMTVDNPADPLNTGWYTSIGADSKNRPHISYLEYTNYDLRYAYFDGANWNTQTVDSEGSAGWYSSLELDSHDQPHIAYLDSPNSTLKYASFDGKSWIIETVDNGGAIGGISLALDKSDRPHISYQGVKHADLKHTYYDGARWVKETVDSSVSIGDFTSIALDSSNHPAIAYYDDTNDILKYAKFDGNKWDIVTDQSGRSAWYPSLAMDNNNNPHISYYDATDQNLNYIYFDGSNWRKEVVDTQGDVGWYTSLVIDNNNNPHISYLDNTNFFLKYATKSGSSWTITTVDKASFAGYYTSIDIDATGRSHISYHGAANKELKYAFLNRAPVLSPIGNKAVAEGKTLTFTISATDQDGDSLIFSATNVPPGAKFDPNTGTFSWTPGLDQAGVYTAIIFEAGDRFEVDRESITITVTKTNQPPTLNPIGNKTIKEGDRLTFTISGIDPDGDPLTYSATNLPKGATFSGQTFSWRPGFDQAGTYSGIHFAVSDGAVTGSEDIIIVVTDAGPPLSPTLLEPEQGEAGIMLTPTFSWQPGNYSEYFRLQVAANPSFSQLVADIPQLTQNSYTPQSPMPYGVTYYWRVIASNFDGETYSKISAFITIESPELQEQTSTRQIPAAKGIQHYRMISVPLYPENPDAQAVLGGDGEDDLEPYDPAKWRLLRYDPSTQTYKEYPDIAPFAPGLAYWLITTAGITPDVKGRAVDTTHPFAIALAPGWNQIGNPFKFLVDWGKVKVRLGPTEVLLSDPANNWVDNAIWEYLETGTDGAEYRPSSQLVPWHGYWVFNSSTYQVELIIPNRAVILLPDSQSSSYAPGKGTISKKDLGDHEWAIQLKASRDDFADNYNFFGVSGQALPGYDNKDLAKPPIMSSEGVKLYFPHKDWSSHGNTYAADFRPPILTEERYDFIVDSGQGSGEIILSWSGQDQVPSYYDLLLVDVEDAKVLNMREAKEYSFYAGVGSQRAFQVLVTNTRGKMSALAGSQ